VCLLLCPAVAAVLWALTPARPQAVRVVIQPAEIFADAHDFATLRIDGPSGARPLVTARGAIIEDLRRGDRGWQARVRSSVRPGRIPVQVQFPGRPPASAEITSILSAADSYQDGTPDFLRLDDDHDRQAFRRWFTYLAEVQYFQPPDKRPAEISDCAALIRYAYREALHAHDTGWAETARVPLVPAYDSVAKYEYPYTPVGASLFRVTEGGFRASDLSTGAFAQFADAHTLRRRNTHFISRDLARALPGDLLFFRQEEGRMPFHSMIWIGESRVRPDGNQYILYHTGPGGEIRRLGGGELLHYPEPQWRPVPGNPNFLGVFRWNILRKASY
jgi:uncharacterized protein YfaT (DUF1175 family)